MKLGFSKAEEEFRAECAQWLNGQMMGEFSDIKGISTLTEKAERRKEWEQQLATHKWSCIGWPVEWGGRGASLAEQVIFALGPKHVSRAATGSSTARKSGPALPIFPTGFS